MKVIANNKDVAILAGVWKLIKQSKQIYLSMTYQNVTLYILASSPAGHSHAVFSTLHAGDSWSRLTLHCKYLEYKACVGALCSHG